MNSTRKKIGRKSIMKDISFIIPVYNTPLDKLKNCIESILKLKNKFDIEIVVVDDGSEQYIEQFFRDKFIEDVIYRYKVNGGVSSARNIGLSIAKGKFIFFADADDMILEEAFDTINIVDDYQLIVFDIDVVENRKENTWKVMSCNPGKIQIKDIVVELVTSSRMNSPCSKLFLNKYIKENGIRFDENMVTCEDMNFVIDFTQCVSNAYYTGKSAYRYLREEASRIARIKKFPEVYLNNLSFSRNKLEKLIEKYELDYEYISKLNIDYIESLYNYLSDLLTLGICTVERKHRVSTEIEGLKIDVSNISTKKKMKYQLLCNNDWAIIYLLAYIRKMYLKLK